MVATASDTDTVAQARSYARRPETRARWLRELGDLLAFPSVSTEPARRPDLEAAAAWLARHLAEIGLRAVRVLPGPGGGLPSVAADWLAAPGQPTLLIYGHFDVQPPGPLAAWRSPPFQATRDGDLLVARGASDDKGQLFAQLKALESLLATSGGLPVNVKVWLEGEEEAGSPNLASLLEREGERLRADAALIADTQMATPGQPALVLGFRGLLRAAITVRSAAGHLHAGRHGGAVANPLGALAALVAALHHPNGRVAIPGFYERVRETRSAPPIALRSPAPSPVREWGEPGYTTLERTTIRPALTVTGVAGGHMGGAAIIPDRATARVDIRLVPDQSPDEIAHLLRRFVAANIPAGMTGIVRLVSASPPVIIPPHHPSLAAAARAVTQVWGVPPVPARSGGTIAFVEQIRRRWGMPAIVLGWALPEDNSHGPNERLHLPTFYRGIETIIALLAEYRRDTRPRGA